MKKKKIIINQKHKVIFGETFILNMKVTVSISWTVSINTTLSVEEYLKKIRPYFKNMMNNFKKSDAWKIQIITINFISSIDDDE